MLEDVEIKELEQSLIQSIVFDPECIFNVCEVIDPNDIENAIPKEIFTKAIEFLAKSKEYSSLDILESVSMKSKDYIHNIQDSFITSAKVEVVAKKLKEHANAQNTRKKVSAILSEKNVTAKELVEKFERVTFGLSQQQNGYSYVDMFKTGEQIVTKAKNMGEIEGYSWGLKKLDAVTGGMVPGKTYVIGGTKKTGKTKFVINTIYHLWQKELPCLFLSLEMNEISVVRWLVSRFSNEDISTEDYKYKDRLDINRFEKVLDDLASHDLIYIDTRPGLSFLQIKNQVWRHLQHKVKVVFVDYLQRMYIDSQKDSRATAIQKTMGYLADMAKQYNIALVILSQLANIAEGTMGKIQHLKESGGIAENVDCILILNNIDRVENNLEPSKKKNQVYISVEQRDGESQLIKCYTKLQFNKYAELIEPMF